MTAQIPPADAPITITSRARASALIEVLITVSVVGAHARAMAVRFSSKGSFGRLAGLQFVAVSYLAPRAPCQASALGRGTLERVAGCHSGTLVTADQ